MERLLYFLLTLAFTAAIPRPLSYEYAYLEDDTISTPVLSPSEHNEIREENDTQVGGILDELIVSLIETLSNGTSESSQGRKDEEGMVIEETNGTNALGNEQGLPMKDCERTLANGEKSPYKYQCQMLESFYVMQEQSNGNDDWMIWFEMKGSLKSAEPLDQVIEHYVIRLVKMDDRNESNKLATTFLLVPWNRDQEVIKIEPLQSGEYIFQICAITASFQPSFLDSSEFSWEKHAPSHYLHLNGNPQAGREVLKEDPEAIGSWNHYGESETIEASYGHISEEGDYEYEIEDQ